MKQLTDQFMEGIIGTDGLAPGGIVSIVQNGQVVYKQGYGYADIENHIVPDPNQTIFRIGSVTKTFAAAGIMKLVDQGKVDLHVDISNYLQDVQFENPYTTPITLHDLLTHTSGFQVTTEEWADYNPNLSESISLKAYIEQFKPAVVREPGKTYMYDNYAFNLLGYIIESVSGMTYEAYMKENVFGPLEMHHSEAVIAEQMLPHLAVGYGKGGTVVEPYTLTPTQSADGGMLTTAEDAAHFLIAQLDKGVWQGKKVWEETSVAQMHQFHSSIHPLFPDTTYGYENLLEATQKKGQYMVVKGGDVPGYSAFIVLIPEQEIGIFMAFNRMSSSGYLASQFIQLISEQFVSIDQEVIQQPSYVYTPQEELSQLEGTYSDLRVSLMLTEVRATRDGELSVKDLNGTHVVQQKDAFLFEDEKGSFIAFKEVNGKLYLKYSNLVGYSQKVSTSFCDVAADDVYAPFIGNLKAMGIVQGHNEEQYHPEKPLTRAELAAMLIRSMSVSKRIAPSTGHYVDTIGHWAENEIETVTSAGYMKGSTAHTFDPERLVTRQEAASILSGMAKITVPLAFATLDLDQIVLSPVPEASLPFIEDLQFAVAFNLVGPDVQIHADETVEFRPQDALTRKEAALWIHNFILHLILGV